MSGSNPDSLVLTAAHAAFMHGPVSMNVAARGADNFPTVMRAYGCAVTVNRSVVRLFIYPSHNERLLQHIQDNGVIAAVFNRPINHETIQLKGRDAVLEPVSAVDLAVMQTYRELMTVELRAIGYPSPFTHTLLPPPGNEAAAICFTPIQAFTQTPGPNAGQKLKA